MIRCDVEGHGFFELSVAQGIDMAIVCVGKVYSTGDPNRNCAKKIGVCK